MLNCFVQNDFEIFGFKFESKTPVPIDSLITNLGETAYVVSFSILPNHASTENLSFKHPWVAASHIRWL